MDESVWGKFKKGRREWLEKYKPCSEEVAWSNNSGKNCYKVDQARKRKEEYVLKYVYNIIIII